MSVPSGRAFDESLHRRDWHGRFTDKSVAGAGTDVDTVTSGYRVARRTEAADWDDDIESLSQLNEGDHDDPRLARMWQIQGYDDRPQVVTAAEMSALPDDHVRVYRGINGKRTGEYAEAYRSGDDPFPGLGLGGNGTYSSTSLERARSYTEGRWTDEGPGAFMTLAIRPEARVVSARDLDRRLFSGDIPPELDRLVDGDPGKLATALGYDVIQRGWTHIILNRTAVIVQEA